ncbi:DNA methyltransferase [Streptomyces violaceusniger]|uniref:DNA methyltransferase n=1 Tax=Streptomyces violaceusniger TaxID=68280 RepID=UPI00338A8450
MILPYYTDGSVTLHTGDAAEVLRDLPDDCADCVVTPPPYWGLRDYGTGNWTGGNPSCAHSTGRGTNATQRKHPSLEYPASAAHRGGDPGTCLRCGAVREDRQYGLEATPEDYVDHLRAVFAELRRVVAATGTVWLNLGDSYSSTPPGHTNNPMGKSTLDGRPARGRGPHWCDSPEESLRYAVAGRLCVASRRVDPAQRDHLAQTQRDAGIGAGPAVQPLRDALATGGGVESTYSSLDVHGPLCNRPGPPFLPGRRYTPRPGTGAYQLFRTSGGGDQCSPYAKFKITYWREEKGPAMAERTDRRAERPVLPVPADSPRMVFEVRHVEGSEGEQLRLEQAQAIREVVEWVAQKRSESGHRNAA